MTKIQNFKPVYNLEERALQFVKQANELKRTYSGIIKKIIIVYLGNCCLEFEIYL